MPSYEWYKFHIQYQIIGFTVYYIFLGFRTCFCQITACNTRRDVIIICYFHTVKITTCKRFYFYSLDKTMVFYCWKCYKSRYFMPRNVIKACIIKNSFDFSIFKQNHYTYFKWKNIHGQTCFFCIETTSNHLYILWCNLPSLQKFSYIRSH